MRLTIKQIKILSDASDSVKSVALSREVLRAHGSQIARDVRKVSGLTQREMAKRLGCSNVYLCKLEGGSAPMTVGLAAKFFGLWSAAAWSDTQRKGR
jgi:DNA-binding XRE family transcriptional regulator